MEIIELIIDILEHSDKPLKQGEILDLAKLHPHYHLCTKLQNVRVPLSAVARCLTKYSSGSNPVIGIYDEGKVKHSQKRFFLRSKNIPSVTLVSELSLHPYLVKFAKSRFNVYCKTINALKVSKKKDKIGKWTNPDIVGINPTILSLTPLFQREIEKLGMFSTKVFQFYSFELKLKIDKSNITECYFQAVSNSNWANYAYLVVGDMDTDPAFIDNLIRLNNGYGVGIIKLDTEDPLKSEVILSARERDIVDINFMNFLSDMNKDFYNFIASATTILKTKRIEESTFDPFA